MKRLPRRLTEDRKTPITSFRPIIFKSKEIGEGVLYSVKGFLPRGGGARAIGWSWPPSDGSGLFFRSAGQLHRVFDDEEREREREPQHHGAHVPFARNPPTSAPPPPRSLPALYLLVTKALECRVRCFSDALFTNILIISGQTYTSNVLLTILPIEFMSEKVQVGGRPFNRVRFSIITQVPAVWLLAFA